MKKLIVLTLFLLLTGCAWKFMYGLQIEYEGDKDEIKEEVGRDGENK